MGESLSWFPRLVRKRAPDVKGDIISRKKSHTAVIEGGSESIRRGALCCSC